MRLAIQILLLVWGAVRQSRADNFAAVSGTGWTDISQLSSTCSTAGYFVNPSDCSKFYNCVDHSTPEHRLLLRYDFDCPGGLAFNEGTNNCDYPGPSGCVTSSSGSGWGWPESPSGIWQSTATVSKVPSWGTPTRHPVSTTVIHSGGSTGGRTIIRGPSTPAPFASNPRGNLPGRTIVQVPVTAWESLRIRPHNSGGFQPQIVTEVSSGEGGWSPTKLVNSGVFQSAKVTQHSTSGGSVTWGSSKIIPVESTGVFQSARVTPVPHTEWETPQSFPVTPQPIRVAQTSVSGWSAGGIRVSPTPAPAPANPTVHKYLYNTVTPTPGPVAWQGTRLSPVPHAPSVSVQGTTADISQVQQQAEWQSSRISQIPQTQSSGQWQSFRVSQIPQTQPAEQWQGTAGVSQIPQIQPPEQWQGTRVSQFPQTQSSGQWQSTRVSQIPQPHSSAQWQSARISQVPQNPSVSWQSARIAQSQGPTRIAWNAPQAANPSLNYAQDNLAANPSFHIGPEGPAAANPSQLNFVPSGQAIQANQHYNVLESNSVAATPSPFNAISQNSEPANPTVTVPAGWENVRITKLPSGYIWQSSPTTNRQTQGNTIQQTQGEVFETSSPAPPAAPSQSLQAGNFGIVQQVINEQENGQGSDGKSHIQLVYETKENQELLNPQSQAISSQNLNQAPAVQRISSNNLGNSVYEFIAPPDSGLKGRIIVLYAPLNSKGEKREAPVIEVEVEDSDDDNNEESKPN